MDESKGFIEIKVTGIKDGIKLTPENYDIQEVVFMLQEIENLLHPYENKKRPIISYEIQNGSVKHIFKTSIQLVIGFNAILGQLNEKLSWDLLEPNTSKAFEKIYHKAQKFDYEFEFKTSLENTAIFKINKNTVFSKKEPLWLESEFYFYGKIVNAGGKNDPNIHIDTEEFGTIKIHTPMSFLEKLEKNLLYKIYGIRALGKQNSQTNEIDKSSFQFLELIEYQPKYDEEYLKSLQKKAQKSWKDIDAEEWLKQIRGYND